ncbi:hypothetical protein Cgig2_004344 [Carnegiea gigantea]|uniref:beta-ketoacyl-[acyl-carrier-protein] synthase I n=1 Tax=Carnegiea gigantea TaxID=171969 RepID=A0A9Q1JYZ7_9CARY|nr:hypothetical protein Cgig2_004344 [Carnegiea gigantea]
MAIHQWRRLLPSSLRLTRHVSLSSSNRRRRVVVTGLGMVTPLGCGVETTWKRLIEGECGVRAISSKDLKLDGFDAETQAHVFDQLTSKVAAIVPSGTNPGEYNEQMWLNSKLYVYGLLSSILKKYSCDDKPVYIVPCWNSTLERSISRGLLPMLCVPLMKPLEMQIGLQMSRTRKKEQYGLHDRGVSVGGGIGSISDIVGAAQLICEKRLRRLSPYFIPRILINIASGHVSMKYGFQGPNHAAVTACATGAHSIGDAARMILFGDADVMLAGGTEASIDALSIAGFCR